MSFIHRCVHYFLTIVPAPKEMATFILITLTISSILITPLPLYAQENFHTFHPLFLSHYFVDDVFGFALYSPFDA